MKKYTVIIAAIAASALSFTAQADSLLYGSIGFNGTATPSPLPLQDATQVTVTSATVDNSGNTDSYAIFNGANAAAGFNNPIPLAVANYGTPGVVLFTAQAGGNTYAFYDVSTTASGYNALFSQWQATGTGDAIEYSGDLTTAQVVADSGLTEIASSYIGTWNFGVSASQDTFSFAGTGGSSETIPDGGLTVALLGGALVGLQMFRRKLLS